MTERHELPIVVLSGPTGVGKTRIAVELCRLLGGEIVGADSVQVYRGFDIGSCKPTHDELLGVPHHLLDVVEPDEDIDAARFASLADAAIDDVASRNKIPFVVGGTGLWLRALLRGLVALPPVDVALRARLSQAWRDAGPEAMHAQLLAVDPLTAAGVHASDMVRVVRALEVHAQTGLALGELRRLHALGAPRYRSLMLVLDTDPHRWAEQLAARTRSMLARGWVDEVRALRERYGRELRPMRSVGYRQIAESLDDAVSPEILHDRVLFATRQYGKRQRNWFRSEPTVDQWLGSDAALSEETLARIKGHVG